MIPWICGERADYTSSYIKTVSRMPQETVKKNHSITKTVTLFLSNA